MQADQRTNCVNCRTKEYRAGAPYEGEREGGESTNDIESMLMCNVKNPMAHDLGDDVT